MITIRLFGPIEISAGASAVKVDSRKALALLSYLIVAGRPISRGQLLGVLWADMAEDRARANLSWTLNRLGSLLPNRIYADRASVRFVAGADVSVDLDSFQRQAESNDEAELRAALEWYRGPLLDGLELQGCAEFEYWLTVERERYEQRAALVVQRLSDLCAGRGAYADAAGLLARLLALDPLREEAHRQRMLMLAKSNQRSAALAQFEFCRRVLHDELHVEPEPETMALAEDIRQGRFERPSFRDADRSGEEANAVVHVSGLRLAGLAPLIGRESELAEIGRMLHDPTCRLITIVGFGGMGKTRLAQAAAERAAGQFRDGAAFIALAATDLATMLPMAIAEALGVDTPNQVGERGRVLDLLRTREQLLVLDNIEHLLDGVDLIGDIVAEAAGVRLLVTSQARLGLADEWVFDLRGLRLPVSDDYQVIADSDAVQLFVRQARRVQASFTLDDTNRDAVVRICRAVWGHPLAIEVAASWVRTLSPAEIAAEIDAGAGLLTATVRDKPARHRSAQAMFSYGWARLGAEEQQAFALLSVFPADFSRDAATALLAPLAHDDAAAALALVAALVDKSLLRRLRNGRYVLHNLLRRFAARKLRPEEAEAAQARHWQFFSAYVCSHEMALRSQDSANALAAIGTELADIRAGWLWAAQQTADLLSAAFDSLVLFYTLRGWYRAGADLFGETATRLESVQLHTPLLARVRAAEAMFASRKVAPTATE